ncbi:MAG: class I SAM-dependent methyltransferase [Pirellulales bacterium]|nr:class I SAM-dependent methyltransferase [Pirellulales bacterium]
MKQLTRERPRPITDWDGVYRQGTPAWDSGIPHAELIRVMEEKRFPKGGTVLELGCGSGADAICMAKRRYEVTAVECSPIALERARLRAEREDALLRLVLDDVFEFALTAGQFDLVYDCGFYHWMRLTKLEPYLDMLWHLTRPGSWFFCLAGALDERAEGGPPQVTEDDIRFELGRLFEFVHLRHARLESPLSKHGFKAWSCLMRRPTIKK